MPTTSFFTKTPTRGALLTTWPAIPNGNQGLAQSAPNFQHSVQVTGTAGAGGSVQMEGSNDGGVTWSILHTPAGTQVIFAAAAIPGAILVISERPILIRPNVTAGDGTTAINIYLASVSDFI